MKKLGLLIIIIFTLQQILAQDIQYAKNIISKLTDKSFFGRGYVNKGDSIAANFLAIEMKNIGVKKFNQTFYQHYDTSFNSIIDNPKVTISGTSLKLMDDFLIHPASNSIQGKFKVYRIKGHELKNRKKLQYLIKKDWSNTFLILDTTGINNKELGRFAKTITTENFFNAKGIIDIQDGKLMYSARTYQNKFPVIQIKRKSIPDSIGDIELEIKSKFLKNYQTQNLAGYIQGSVDTFIVFTAHYDHIGMLGNIHFPGANDNASGVAMVLNIAKHFAKNKPYYSMAFLLFSGEEAGLLGSRYYADNPLFPLKSIKTLFNFDMVGTGEDGLLAINSKPHPKVRARLLKLNENKKYFKKFYGTGKASNSDHYPFHAKGVPAVFMLTMKDNAPYHVPEDNSDTLSLIGFENLFNLIVDYTNPEN